MKNLVVAEFMKLKRYNIINIGALGILFSTVYNVVMWFQHRSVFNGDFDWFVSEVLWINLFFILPMIITLIGGYIFKREYDNDTMKNLIIIPVNRQKLITSKLIVTGCTILSLSFISFIFTVIVGVAMKLEGLTTVLLLKYLWQFSVTGIFCFAAMLPLLSIIIAVNKGYFIATIVSLFYGFLGIVAASSSISVNLYPLSAVLSILNYKDGVYNTLLSYMTLILTTLIAIGILKTVCSEQSN